MDALEILKRDHQKVRELFHEATRGEQNKRKDIFDKIDTELEIHAHIEETVFYPALEQHEELKDMVAEALEEHQEVKTLLEEIEELGSENHDFGAKLQELMETVEHHVSEEEGEMFPKVFEVFDEKELDELGDQLNSTKGIQHRESTKIMRRGSARNATN
jgi:hemerythrin superfamily protein